MTRGRPRDPDRHAAVLQATRDLLVTVGYSGVSFSEVAKHAGVGRQLLYRWWPTKRALVSEAIGGIELVLPSRYPGPLERDLRSFLTGVVGHASRPDVLAAALGLTVDSMEEVATRGDTQTLLDDIEQNFVGPFRRSFAALTEAARARGELREGLDEAMTLDTILGALFVNTTAFKRTPSVVIDHLTDTFLRALRS